MFVRKWLIVSGLIAAAGIPAACSADPEPKHPPAVRVVNGLPPASAQDSAAGMLSADVVQRRKSFAPEIAAQVPDGAKAPAGATITLDPDGWNQLGDHASATGVVSVPGRAQSRTLIGFKLVDGRWVILFQETLP